jgi:hypothetical protein
MRCRLRVLAEAFQFLGFLADQPVIPLTAVVLVLRTDLRSGSVQISNCRAARRSCGRLRTDTAVVSTGQHRTVFTILVSRPVWT